MAKMTNKMATSGTPTKIGTVKKVAGTSPNTHKGSKGR